MLDKQGYMHARACTRPRAPAPALTHARTRTHTDKYIILIAFPRQQWFRDRTSMLRCPYFACIVDIYTHEGTEFRVIQKTQEFRHAQAVSVMSHPELQMNAGTIVLWSEI